MTTRMEAIEHDGRSNTVTGPEELIRLWMTRNRHAVDTGLLPDGMLHFDLLFKVDNL